ncbi:MAG: hypothetical protein P8Y70_18015 [Candidatus Lokiarchaeota archaeon]
MVLKIKHFIVMKCLQMMKTSGLYISIILLGTVSYATNLNAQIKKVPENEKIFELGMLRNSFINVNINDASVAVNTWANKLRDKLKIDASFKLVIFNSTEEMVSYNKKKNLGMVILNSIDFIKLRSRMSLYPIFTSTKTKNIFTKLLIITKKSDAKNIFDLKGEKLGFYLRRNK